MRKIGDPIFFLYVDLGPPPDRKVKRHKPRRSLSFGQEVDSVLFLILVLGYY